MAQPGLSDRPGGHCYKEMHCCSIHTVQQGSSTYPGGSQLLEVLAWRLYAAASLRSTKGPFLRKG